MAHDQTTSPTPRPTSIPFKKEGWLPAILTIIAGILVPATAYYIHTQTYRHPTDVMMRQVYEERDRTGGAAH